MWRRTVTGWMSDSSVEAELYDHQEDLLLQHNVYIVQKNDETM